MANPELIKETPISASEVKEKLEEIKKKEELGYRSAKTLEHLEQIKAAEIKKAREAVQNLTKLKIPRLKDQHIIKIAELMPKTIEDLRVVLQGYIISVSNDNMKKIIEVTSKY